ncbi:two-component system, OmpR family, sensor histidine kinase VicK [Paenibacillus algorifonticola]|uniref:histidine kinase n=1 Tax=Paenibacillus algorifonticola TaxID=684063 RepID=A0A1I2DPS4_9BACL|nr:cell wall metabolism sensor histidine kinase WalK [Paenibacillus algorifonticola]SFE82467.1 two-component system, OmpR family, sensor histidine kinase VicK [Paenibacillus algorifonticola]
MRGRRFFRTIQVKLVIIYLLLILVAMQLIGVYFISTVKTSLTDSFTNNLKEQADILSKLAARHLSIKPGGDLDTNAESAEGLSLVVRNLFSISGTEVQVLDANGKIVATSVQVPESYVGKKNPSLAVSRALVGIPENEEEIIDENNVRKKIIALPVTDNDNDNVLGAVYMVASMDSLYDTVNRVNQIFFSGTLIALGLTGVLGILLAHTITSPIQGLTRQAAAVAEGKFDFKVPVLGDDEIGRLSMAFNDMTIRLKEALSVNEEENEKLNSILSNMSDGVIAADEHGKVIVWNRRSLEMLDRKSCENCSLTELLALPQQRLDELRQGKEQTLILDRGEEAEMDEAEGIMRVTFTPIHRRDKGTTGTIVVLQDVTEQEKLEQSRRQFVANVSHELRTPLTTIKSYAEALNDGALAERELSERFVGVISNETERMIRLVTDLLHLSRLDSNQAPMRRRQTNIHDMLDEVADRFSFQLRQKSIRAFIQVDSELKEAWLDRDQIDQVLDNLFSNAIKYTLDGGKIQLSARKQEQALIAISVKDTGIGIPKRDLQKIFDRFYRVDKARSRNMGGTGLGLSIAREIVKAHGGTISLNSELNVGTTVTFTLPMLEEDGERS